MEARLDGRNSQLVRQRPGESEREVCEVSWDYYRECTPYTQGESLCASQGEIRTQKRCNGMCCSARIGQAVCGMKHDAQTTGQLDGCTAC